MSATVQLDSDVFVAFIFYGALVLGKVFSMAFFTAVQRYKHMTVPNKEDAGALGKGTIVGDHPDIEHVRKCHLNDLENAVPFVLTALVYCFTGPSYSVAVWHFRIFTIARFLHTFVYLNAIKHASRGITFFAGYLVCVSMVVQSLMFAVAV